MVGAVKHDGGKAGYHLLPSDALEEIVAVLDYGANKYGERNWEKGMQWSRPFSACMRHLWAWWRGEEKDPESGLSHLAHAGCSILFLLSYQRTNNGDDNRAIANKSATHVFLGNASGGREPGVEEHPYSGGAVWRGIRAIADAK